MGDKKKMTQQEIISRIIELEMIVTEALSKGHMETIPKMSINHTEKNLKY